MTKPLFTLDHFEVCALVFCGLLLKLCVCDIEVFKGRSSREIVDAKTFKRGCSLE